MEAVRVVDGSARRLTPHDLRRLPSLSVQSLKIAPSGGLWIGTSRGLYLYDSPVVREPADFVTLLRRVVTAAPEPLLDAATVGSNPALFPLPEIEPAHKRLRLEFGATSYVQPERTQFRTRLLPYEPKWSEWTSDAHKEYTNLASGSYQFEVQARNGLGQEGRPATLDLRVRASWYQTPLAWLAWAVLALISLYAIVRLSQRRLAARNLQLEKLVAERTSELKAQRDLLERLAHEDALTGLGNRRYLDQHLAKEALRARHFERSMTLAMLDIDHFKAVNDTHGHAIGDRVLQRLGRIARDCARPVDIVARYGGEELLLHFPETAASEALELCEQLRTRVAEAEWSDLAPRLSISVSIGVIEAPPDWTLQQVLAGADQALYRAKSGGRNRVLLAELVR